jgi:hypothetical protein
MADAIQTYEDCRQVDISAVLAWISDNTSIATRTCIAEMLMLYGSLQAAVTDMKAHPSSTKILADWSLVSQSLDAAAQGCIPN